MAHDARNVANELIRRARAVERPITPMQVQKLTYYCHAWMLGIYHRPLLTQSVEAWRLGPVIPDVYYSLRPFGGAPITSEIQVRDENYDREEENIIDQVSEKYGKFIGIQLSSMTHASGTPWYQTWHAKGQNAVIPDSLIEEHYAALVNEGS